MQNRAAFRLSDRVRSSPPEPASGSLGFRGFGFRVEGLGLGFRGLAFRGFGFRRFRGLGFWVFGSG